MKRWIQKAIIQKTISYLPWSHRINFLFQKYVTRGVRLTDDYFLDRLEHAGVHLRNYQRYAGKAVPTTCLELGTGWYPVVPICFFLAGAETVFSVDIAILTSKKRIGDTLPMFLRHHASGRLLEHIPVLESRWEELTGMLAHFDNYSLDDLLKKLRITYRIGDASTLALPDESIELVTSNNTLEHIYPDILSGILRELRRIVRKDTGVMSHFIDMSDHFAHFDKSITIYNFLRFSERQWKWIDNSIQPQSRLRVYDYRVLFRQAGIPVNEEQCRPGNPEAVKATPLDRAFREIAPEQLAISHGYFVSDMKTRPGVRSGPGALQDEAGHAQAGPNV